MEQKKTLHSRVVFGTVLIVIGVFFLLANLDIDLLGIWRDAVLSFPMLLILFGLMLLSGKHWVSGLLFVGVGTFYILPHIPYHIVNEDFVSTWWPGLLIYAGVILLLFRNVTVPESKERIYHSDNMHDANVTFDESGKINCRISFSGERQVYNEPVLKGGEIDVNFGGLELDLRNTTLPEGETILNINAHLGGVSLVVPDNWNIEIDTSGFGGFADKRKKTTVAEPNKKLILVVRTFLGGGEVR